MSVQSSDITIIERGGVLYKALLSEILNSRKVSQSVGDGSSTSFNINHNFGTRDVQVSVFKNTGSYDEVIADVARPSVNRVTITFATAPATNAYRVVITG